MKDVRTIEVVRSYEIDFETDSWLIKPTFPAYSVGAGLYLMVPIQPGQERELSGPIMELLEAAGRSHHNGKGNEP